MHVKWESNKYSENLFACVPIPANECVRFGARIISIDGRRGREKGQNAMAACLNRSQINRYGVETSNTFLYFLNLVNFNRLK